MNFTNEIINDTLKKKTSEGVLIWDWARLTMFSAWSWVFFVATFDYIFNGFRWEVWLTMVCVATGVPVAHATSKRIEKGKIKKSNEPEV